MTCRCSHRITILKRSLLTNSRMRDDVAQLVQLNARTLDDRKHGLRDALLNHHVEQVYLEPVLQ